MRDSRPYILFGQRKHKKFNYKPRFSEENPTDAPLGEDAKPKEFISKWRLQTGNKVRMKAVFPLRTLILLLVLLLIGMYLLEKKYM